MKPKYPNIKVKLSGVDSNAFVIMGTVRRALRKGGVPANEISEFSKEATSGDYDHLLQTAIAWVDVR